MHDTAPVPQVEKVFDPDRLNAAQRYASKRSMRPGAASTFRKLEKALRILNGVRPEPPTRPRHRVPMTPALMFAGRRV